jgi:hypothetical protein
MSTAVVLSELRQRGIPACGLFASIRRAVLFVKKRGGKVERMFEKFSNAGSSFAGMGVRGKGR